MKKRLRFIQIAFTVSFLIMVGLSLYSLKQFSQLTEYSDRVDHTQKVISQLHQLENLIQEFDILERSYMLTRDSGSLSDLRAFSRNLYPVIDRLQELNKKDSLQYYHLTMLKSAVALRMSLLRDHIHALDSLPLPPLSPAYKRSLEIQKETRGYIHQIKSKENLLLQERFQGKIHYQRIASETLKYMMVVFGLVSLFLFLAMLREFKRRLLSQDQLQKNLIDLKRSHAELEQIAFAASHDLQEPLRKIRVFGNRLMRLQKNKEDSEVRDTVERINYAAGRMQELIEDMVNLTRLVHETEEMESVDLNRVLNEVLTGMADRIQACKGTVHLEVLPQIMGHPGQIQTLFKALIDNAVKFSRPDRPLILSIRADRTTGEELRLVNKSLIYQNFYRITVADNGIGFDNQFAPKIFMIFQRLHSQKSEYEGKGIGLAICQRIMANHNGYIVANGHMEVGATFKLFFPSHR